MSLLPKQNHDRCGPSLGDKTLGFAPSVGVRSGHSRSGRALWALTVPAEENITPWGKTCFIKLNCAQATRQSLPGNFLCQPNSKANLVFNETTVTKAFVPWAKR